MNAFFEKLSYLQLKIKNLTDQLAAFKSGKAYQDLKKELADLRQYYEKKLKKRDIEVADAHKETKTVRNNLLEVNEDLQKEQESIVKKLFREIKQLKDKIFRLEGQLDAERSLSRERLGDKYALMVQLEEANGKIFHLTAQLKQDYENSSRPSSEKILHKKIHNSRQKTGKKPGGQDGHRGHCRKRLAVTGPTVFLEAPEEIRSSPAYYKTGKIITKQVVDVRLTLVVTEYSAYEYRNRETKTRYHVPFPSGINNEVNYGAGLQALLYYLNNYCNVPVEKTREFVRELTDGTLHPSVGMINQLGKKLSLKTRADRQRIFTELLRGPVLYSDATVGRVNGEGKAVIVCANEQGVLYFFKDKKGHEGLKDTPVETYQQTLVHDHDKTYYNYGGSHQECLAHILRCLKASMENEPDLKWNKEMHQFLRKMIHEVKQDRNLEEAACQAYETEYHRILEIAEEEYNDIPPSDYYRDGYNLQKRMREYAKAHLHFLRHPEVEYTNNRSERHCRKYKRKQKQAVTFRSKESGEDYCNGLSVIETAKLRGKSTYQELREIFN